MLPHVLSVSRQIQDGDIISQAPAAWAACLRRFLWAQRSPSSLFVTILKETAQGTSKSLLTRTVIVRTLNPT